jgi:hypothetical protein
MLGENRFTLATMEIILDYFFENVGFIMEAEAVEKKLG